MEKFLFFFRHASATVQVRLAITVKVTSLDVDKVNFTGPDPTKKGQLGCFLIILMKSLIIGGLVGVGGELARRGCSTPDRTGMGAFRTLASSTPAGIPLPTSRSVWASSSNAWASHGRGRRLHSGRGSPHPAELGCSGLMIRTGDLATTLHDPKRWPSPAASQRPSWSPSSTARPPPYLPPCR